MAANVARGAVLVTGGAGFIGSHVAEALLARGEVVVVADEINDYYDVRLKRANLNLLKNKWGDRVSIREGDLCDPLFVAALFEPFEVPSSPPQGGGEDHNGSLLSVRVDRVVHLAARAGVRPSIEDPLSYVQANVTATTRLLEASRMPFAQKKDGNEAGGGGEASLVPGVSHFVYASSSSVYGDSAADNFTEADAVDAPVSPYAATKKTCELFAHTFTHLYGVPTTGLRFFTVYGPRGRPDMAPFKFVDRVARGLEIQQFGDGSTSRDYTYIDDIVDGVVRSLDRPNGYQIYNLGNGDPVPLKTFIGIVEKSLNKPANIAILPPQPGDVDRTCANINKAKAELGYAPRTSFEDGIAKTVAWYRDDYWPQYGAPLNTAASTGAGTSSGGASVDQAGGVDDDNKSSGGAVRSVRSDSEKFDGPPTEELELWPGGVERRLRSLSGNTSGGGGGAYSDDNDDGEESTTDNEGNGGAAGSGTSSASGKGVGKAAEQRRLRRLLPKKLPRALPPAATALLASLHLDVRTSAQAAAITPANNNTKTKNNSSNDDDDLDAQRARALNAQTWTGGDFGQGLPPPLMGGKNTHHHLAPPLKPGPKGTPPLPAAVAVTRPAVQANTFDEPVEF